MDGSQACPRCGSSVAPDAAWCGKCGLMRGAPIVEPAAQSTSADSALASSGTSSMPIGQGGWSWFKRSWRSASTALKVALGALFAGAAYVYLFLGPVVFDVSYWVLGKVSRVRADRRFRIGISGALAVAYFGVLAIAGSTAKQPVAAGPTSAPHVAAVVTNEPTRASLATSAGATTQTSPSAVASTGGAPASPQASSVDADDEGSSSAGPSFAASATGVVPPTAGGSPADRLPGEPDPVLTPGALNPDVTQATISSTICVSGWTATVRPSSSYTTALKIQQIVQYGYSDTRTSSYEEDHLISLELGGAPADPRNLWPQPYTVTLADGRSTGAYTKDGFETKLKSEVCAGTITLAAAQSEIGDHWVHAYYGITLAALPTAESSATPSPAHTDTPSEPAATPEPVAPKATPTDPYAAAKAAGATAICADGTLSFSPSRSGTCSKHGGVHWWTGNVGAAGPGAH
jgi:Protein of unknown function (DUF3761)